MTTPVRQGLLKQTRAARWKAFERTVLFLLVWMLVCFATIVLTVTGYVAVTSATKTPIVESEFWRLLLVMLGMVHVVGVASSVIYLGSLAAESHTQAATFFRRQNALWLHKRGRRRQRTQQPPAQ